MEVASSVPASKLGVECKIFLECSMTLCWVMALNALKCFLKLNVRKINSIEMKHDINLIWKQLRPKLKQSTIIWNVSNSPGSDWSFEPLKSRLSNFYIFIGIGISSQCTSAVYLNYRFPSKLKKIGFNLVFNNIVMRFWVFL